MKGKEIKNEFRPEYPTISLLELMTTRNKRLTRPKSLKLLFHHKRELLKTEIEPLLKAKEFQRKSIQ